MVRYSGKTRQTVHSIASGAVEINRLVSRLAECAKQLQELGIETVDATHEASRQIGLEKLQRFVEAIERATEEAVVRSSKATAIQAIISAEIKQP